MTEEIKNLKHVYFEIGAELLSKPNALAQIIEGRGETALVFCNTPSDTDLVEVLLKKRGIAARKLIGNVPPPKLEKTLAQLTNREISTLVVTDIAARGLDIDQFDIIINYTAPSDGDTYLHRLSKTGEFTRLKTVATLVGPLDITNFHYVKKTVDSEFTIEELPGPEQIQRAKIDRLSAIAAQKNAGDDSKYAPLVEAIIKHKDKDAIIALLLQNTLEVLPSLQVAAEREEEPVDDDGFGRQDQYENRGNRGDRGDRDRDRGDRGGDRRHGGRGGRDRDRGDRGDRGDRHQRRPYADLDDESVMQAEEAQNRRKPRPMLPPLREARIYFGQGTDQGFSEDSLKSLVQKEAGIALEDVKRVVLRKSYAFFDVLDEQSNAVLEKLSQSEASGGKKVCIKKATVISTQRAAPSEESGEDSGSVDPHVLEAQEVA